MVESPSPSQLRGARGMLDWSIMDLAKAAKVSVSTIKRFETDGLKAVSRALADKMQGALELEGVRFLLDDGSGPGVRLRSNR